MVFGKRKSRNFPTIKTLQKAEGLNVGLLEPSEVSVCITINEFANYGSENTMQVVIKNEGEKQLRGLVIYAEAPNHVTFVNPKEIFGTSFRQEKLGRLDAGKEITYRVNLRITDDFESGVIRFVIEKNLALQENKYGKLQVEVPITAGLKELRFE
jgi:hypothetical protein